MNWTEQTIRSIVQDMAAENPLACKALLDITAVEFTSQVNSMAVSLEARPTLMINLEFCRKNLQTETDVKCVLLHEFLHVLLCHHLQFERNTPLLNIALDAAINAIIHRIKGPSYSDFFARFYPWTVPGLFLRPAPAGNNRPYDGIPPEWATLHNQLYTGKLSAEDLLERLSNNKECLQWVQPMIIFLGNHDVHNGIKIPDELLNNLKRRLGNLPSLLYPGKPSVSEQQAIHARNSWRLNKWRKKTMEALSRCVIPDTRGLRAEKQDTVLLPVLSMEDRRAAMLPVISNLMPFSRHTLKTLKPDSRCVVYLDVSGSMSNELNQLLSLLSKLRQYILIPLYTFSNTVDKARFTKGKIEISSTGGTAIGPVFTHIRENQFRRALIVTDGYVEQITPAMTAGLNLQQIHVLISSEGNPEIFQRLKMPYRQLPKLNTPE